jgi:hypothetical protein
MFDSIDDPRQVRLGIVDVELITGRVQHHGMPPWLAKGSVSPGAGGYGVDRFSEVQVTDLGGVWPRPFVAQLRLKALSYRT